MITSAYAPDRGEPNFGVVGIEIRGDTVEFITPAEARTFALQLLDRAAHAAQCDNDALARIHGVMSGAEWSGDTIQAVAEIVESTGRKIEPPA